jgi:hypothetical protein
VSALERIDPAELSAIGFSSVFVACAEDEMRWHAEQAAAFTRSCQAAGLEVYAVPVGYGKVMDPDPSIDSLYVHEHPQNLQIDSRGRRCAKACPNNPAFLEWFSSSMRTLAWLLECNGFLWDEPSFYYSRGNWACRCGYCQRLFYSQHQRDLPVDLDEAAMHFRRRSIVMFLLAAAAATQAADRRLLSLVMPSWSVSSREVGMGTDGWDSLLESSAVDRLSVYAAWQTQGREMETAIRSTYEAASRAAQARQKGSVMWVGGSPHPRDKLLEALQVAHLAGVEHLVIAGYETLVGSPQFSKFRKSLTRLMQQVS